MQLHLLYLNSTIAVVAKQAAAGVTNHGATTIGPQQFAQQIGIEPTVTNTLNVQKNIIP